MINRIIGILVIVAVGVLLLPFLLRHADNSLTIEVAKAPPFPSQQAQNDTIHALGERTGLATATSGKKIPKILADSLPTGKLVKIKSYTKDNAWIVEIGTYKDKITALRLVNQLRAKGYKAFIHQKGAAFGEDVGVFIGPEIKRNLAETLASKLAKETKLSTRVKSYNHYT